MFKPPNQIAQNAVNIFHVYLIGSVYFLPRASLNGPIKFTIDCISYGLKPWYQLAAPLGTVRTELTLSKRSNPVVAKTGIVNFL